MRNDQHCDYIWCKTDLMKRIILINGLIAGIFIPLVMGLVILIAGKEGGFTEIAGFASMIIALSTIYLGMRQYRDRIQAGQLTFLQGLKIGLLITLVASGIYVFSWALYYYFGSGQEMMDQYFQQQVDQINQSGGDGAVQERLASVERMRASYGKPWVLIAYTFMEIFPVGLIITLIAALINRR